MRELCVLVCGEPAGTLTQDDRGLIRFSYRSEYGGVPLSLSMPVSGAPYHQRFVRPYLFGLLPDSERQRRAIAEEYDVSANNPVALLEHIGLDCPGAVQFCLQRDPDIAAAIARGGEHRPLTDHDVALRLKSIRAGEDDSWVGMNERWSLGGNQGKFALALVDEGWCSCIGAAPTTHIFKNGVRGYKLQALNEFVCMRAAKACGVPTSEVAYRYFEDEPALIVERYDRVVGNGIRRLHQEDMCQALSIMPDQKYTSDGGPRAQDILSVIGKLTYSRASLQAFTKMLFFNCLVGAPDAHAKNYAILYGVSGHSVLAPMYDVASGLAYKSTRRGGRLAMAIGGENRFGRVGPGAIRRYAGERDRKVAAIFDRNEVTVEWCLETMASLAQGIPEAMESVFDSTDVEGAVELRENLLERVRDNCSRTLALL